MEIVRNSINVAGLADENDLPDRINGMTIQYSEADTIFIPDSQPEAASIFQVIVKVSVHNSRKIKTPAGDTYLLDGTKMVKLIYTQDMENGKVNFLEMLLPFNTYVDVASNTIIDHFNVYILDAYFDLLDSRRIYSNILYFVNVIARPGAHRAVNTSADNAGSSPEVFPPGPFDAMHNLGTNEYPDEMASEYL